MSATTLIDLDSVTGWRLSLLGRLSMAGLEEFQNPVSILTNSRNVAEHPLRWSRVGQRLDLFLPVDSAHLWAEELGQHAYPGKYRCEHKDFLHGLIMIPADPARVEDKVTVMPAGAPQSQTMIAARCRGTQQFVATARPTY